VVIAGQRYPAVVLGADDSSDLAVIRATVPDDVTLVPIERGDSSMLAVGDWVMTVRKVTGTDPETGATLDWGYVGEPVRVKTEAIAQMTDAGVIPVITPLGVGEEAGLLYNVNADIAAVAIAKAMRVRKLVFISDVPGLLRDINDPGSLISTLRLGDVQKLKDDGVISGGMLPKIDSCVEAIEAGVQRVHLVDGRMPHSLLLEIFTKQGVGTEIKADE
jgi:acetylglutamate kinase